ncbi:MAG TPA: hypothetical protein VFH06_02930 [Candidatus Saccharimonadales bacterium]|nr:hypothetical protein [Candidatus Saccharimonadales bacterium]
MSTNSKSKPGWLFTVGMGLASVFMGLGAFALPVLFVGIDLYLGPQFMTNYIDKTGMYSGSLSTIISWAFSVATTGFQYLLFVTVRGINWKSALFEEWLVILFGLFVATMDSAVDLAGFTSLVYGPEQGLNITPDDPSVGFKIIATIVVAMCFLQEVILKPMYDRDKNARPPFDWPGIGIFLWFFKKAGLLYELFCQSARGIAILGVLVLDVFLTYFFFKSSLGTDMQLPVALDLIALAIAIGLTVGQFILYYVGRERSGEGGGGKFKIKEKLNTLTVVAFLFSIVDTVIDLSALTIMMYGPNQSGGFWFLYLPDSASMAYFLIGGSIVLMCARYESLMVAAFKHGFTKTVKGV